MRLRWRFLWPLVFVSVGLMLLCVFTSVSLFRQHADIAEILGENVASRRAAIELKECLLDINDLLKDRVESVESLHKRVHKHLYWIEKLADQTEERELLDRLRHSFAAYLHHWETMPAPGHAEHLAAVKEATELIESDLLKTCEELVQFNARRIQEVAEQHEQLLRQLAWGIAGVSGLGGLAGLVLGFGLARALSYSIRRLEVQIQDAAGRLGGMPAIVLTGSGDLDGLHDQMVSLGERIEAIVKRLQDREREILRAEQMAAVGQLATGVAHEIRNPLTSIKMLVQASLEEGTSLASEDLCVIENEIRRIERSLGTFLDFARPPKLERRSVQMSTLVRAILGLTRGRANKQSVEVVVHAPIDDFTLTADSEQVQQVLVNLVLNALDEMPNGGTLTLTVQPIPCGGVEVRIADTGRGIAPDLMPRLFQPFVSDKETGLGMGLVISRRIIESHGGTLTAANGPTGGAVFTIAFRTENNLNEGVPSDARPTGRG